MFFPLMPQGIAPTVARFIGTMTKGSPARPAGIAAGQLAIGVGGEDGSNQGAIDLGSGVMTLVGQHNNSDDLASKSQWCILDETEVGGSAFSVSGTQSSGAVIVYDIGDMSVLSISEIDVKTGDYSTRTVSGNLSTTKSTIVIVGGIAGNEGSFVENVTDITMDNLVGFDPEGFAKHIRGDNGLGSLIAGQALAGARDDSISARISNPSANPTTHAYLIQVDLG